MNAKIRQNWKIITKHKLNGLTNRSLPTTDSAFCTSTYVYVFVASKFFRLTINEIKQHENRSECSPQIIIPFQYLSLSLSGPPLPPSQPNALPLLSHFTLLFTANTIDIAYHYFSFLPPFSWTSFVSVVHALTLLSSPSSLPSSCFTLTHITPSENTTHISSFFYICIYISFFENVPLFFGAYCNRNFISFMKPIVRQHWIGKIYK